MIMLTLLCVPDKPGYDYRDPFPRAIQMPASLPIVTQCLRLDLTTNA